MSDLLGKTALITGASGNIGSAIATAFASQGANLILHGKSNSDALDELKTLLELDGANVQIKVGAIDSVATATHLVELAKEHYDGLDFLINNAGSFPICELAAMDEKKWREVIDGNLTTAAMLISAASTRMRSGGAIVNIASIEAHSVLPGHAHYAASKAGMIALTRNAAYELGPRDITVNAVSPGLIDRPGLAEQWPQGYEGWIAKVPLGKVGAAADIAATCEFFCSVNARFITGSNLIIDGGMQAATFI